MPDSVTTIGSSAFGGCYNLVEVVNKSPHFTIRKGGFYDSIGYYALAVYNSGDTYTTKLSNDNGVIVYTDGNEKILVGYNGKETDLVIPNSITKINHHAFYSCDNLKSVVIGDSVTSIGDDAFGFCSSLTSVVIPDSVTTIGEYAFAVCGNLKSVVIPDSVTTIGDDAFWVCSSLTSVVIPDSVTTIGSSAFSYCRSLTSVVIPDSVTTIGDDAFEYCSSLKTVYYKGTASDWSSISINPSGNSYLKDATRYYYSETEQSGCWHYDENGEVAVW
ncbi:MAG: leucine-rich repeat domain-containing protein [Clostridia bacterium]|nr:leucine-rich repeat domain-containing protein [Clostridia bacterium]